METSLQFKVEKLKFTCFQVTILILVETSLQCTPVTTFNMDDWSHNPYFSGNLFAINYRKLFWVKNYVSQSLF